MGTDKAVLPVDGIPLARRVAAALRMAGANEVVFVGPSRPELDGVSVEDRYPGEGPFGGLLTALGSGRAPVVVVAACDLLDPPVTVMAELAARAQNGAPVCVPVVDGTPQWHLVAVRRDALPALQTSFDAGERSLHRGLSAVTVEEVVVADPRALADADRPDDMP